MFVPRLIIPNTPLLGGSGLLLFPILTWPFLDCLDPEKSFQDTDMFRQDRDLFQAICYGLLAQIRPCQDSTRQRPFPYTQ